MGPTSCVAQEGGYHLTYEEHQRWDPFVSLNTLDSRRRIQSPTSKTEIIKQSEGDFKIKFLNFSKRL